MPRKTKADLEKEIANLYARVAVLDSENYKLSDEIRELRSRNIDLLNGFDEDLKEIDFGIGKIHYKIDQSSTLVINDLINALKEEANVTPVTDIVKAIKRSSRF